MDVIEFIVLGEEGHVEAPSDHDIAEATMDGVVLQAPERPQTILVGFRPTITTATLTA